MRSATSAGDVPGNENWDLRRVQAIKPITPNDGVAYSVVMLDRGRGSETPPENPAQKNPQVYALRQRANFFGYNAPDWRAMPIKRQGLILGDSRGLSPQRSRSIRIGPASASIILLTVPASPVSISTTST